MFQILIVKLWQTVPCTIIIYNTNALASNLIQLYVHTLLLDMKKFFWGKLLVMFTQQEDCENNLTNFFFFFFEGLYSLKKM